MLAGVRRPSAPATRPDPVNAARLSRDAAAAPSPRRPTARIHAAQTQPHEPAASQPPLHVPPPRRTVRLATVAVTARKVATCPLLTARQGRAFATVGVPWQ